MLRHHHDAYREILNSLGDAELASLHARTVEAHPVLARLIAGEIARRNDAYRPRLTPIEPRPAQIAAAAA